MKAFLLAAGEGTRLRPVTNAVPKCLVPIQGVPMLAIWLELCRRSGISDVLINLHSHASLVREFLSRRDFGVRLRLSDEPELLGSAGTLGANRGWVEGDSKFWVFYADVLTCMDLGKMLRFHEQSGAVATLGAYHVPNPSQCGIFEVDDSCLIQDFVEKPHSPKSDLAWTGVMVTSAELLSAVPPSFPADFGFDVFPRLVGRMAAYVTNEYLVDVGTLANYELAQRTWPGLNVLREGANV